MSTLRPKNWADFQHYKDRSPAWIKLHRGILDDYEFSRLPLASKALAPLLWLLASEEKDGQFTDDPCRIAHRLRWPEHEVVAGLKPLIDSGFFEVASGVLAPCYQDACLEERRGEDIKRETEKNTVQPTAARSRFDDFWLVYPSKKGKEAARKTWQRRKLDAVADHLIAHVQLMQARDDGWQRGFIPMGSTYLNQARWEDEPSGPPAAKTVNGSHAAPSKTLTAIQKLQAMKNGQVDSERDHGRAEQAALPGT